MNTEKEYARQLDEANATIAVLQSNNENLQAENAGLKLKVRDFFTCCCSNCCCNNVKISMFFEELLCLRSVLSEWGEDKSCYVQWVRAEELRELRES